MPVIPKSAKIAGQDSGTFYHKINLKPELGTPLKNVHDWLTNIIRNGQHMMVLVNIQK